MNEIKLFSKEIFMKQLNKQEGPTETIIRLTMRVEELLKKNTTLQLEIARLEGLLLQLDGWHCVECESVYADHCKRYGAERNLCKYCEHKEYEHQDDRSPYADDDDEIKY